jgi:hypothetical protein
LTRDLIEIQERFQWCDPSGSADRGQFDGAFAGSKTERVGMLDQGIDERAVTGAVPLKSL